MDWRQTALRRIRACPSFGLYNALNALQLYLRYSNAWRIPNKYSLTSSLYPSVSHLPYTEYIHARPLGLQPTLVASGLSLSGYSRSERRRQIRRRCVAKVADTRRVFGVIGSVRPTVVRCLGRCCPVSATGRKLAARSGCCCPDDTIRSRRCLIRPAATVRFCIPVGWSRRQTLGGLGSCRFSEKIPIILMFLRCITAAACVYSRGRGAGALLGKNRRNLSNDDGVSVKKL